MKDAAAAVEKLKQSIEQTRAEEAVLKRALAIHDQGRSHSSPSTLDGPVTCSGYDSAISNAPISTDKSQHRDKTTHDGSLRRHSLTCYCSYVLEFNFRQQYKVHKVIDHISRSRIRPNKGSSA